MFKGSFAIGNKSQDIEFKNSPDHIKTTFDGLRSTFDIFVYFTLRKPDIDTVVSVTQVNAKLKFGAPWKELSKAYILTGIKASEKDAEEGEWFSFALDREAFHAIENERNGDLLFLIEFKIALVINKKVFSSGHRFIISQNYRTETASINFTLPRSVWIEKLLPTLGFQNFKLIEVPLNHKSLKEAYDDIILEFNRAEKYFNENDYNKCVAHCRHTLDSLNRNIKKIKANTPSETAFNWLENIDKATIDWIDAVNKPTQAITSKTHHVGLKVDFTKQDAESIYLVTLGLLHFVGHLK